MTAQATNPTIEELRKCRIGDIVSFNGSQERYKLVEVKPNDQFVFEQITKREAKNELAQLSRLNATLRRLWVRN